ncbi:MAG: glycoside hydrolase family 5 protein, partial [Chloroflexota bacterium]|nr:glycoside hydrolase family 5 protein [Chloroflexota bacterium]
MATPAVTIDGRRFVDEHGRTVSLRGVNLGGSSKVPVRPDGRTHLADGFFEHRDVSFVGRPFPLEEADEHLERLTRWGLTFLRLLTTWEAVEHEGQGRYDAEYLAYLRAVVERAWAHGINVFIDPHQDVWSRWTGGDGAPGWTLEAAGINLRNLAATGSALTHQTTGDPFPRMIWPTNGTKLGAATMFTLFFAGDDLLPATRIDGRSAQDVLQSSYIAAMTEVARALADLPNVVGYGTLNEPGSGWIDVADLAAVTGALRLGPSPSPFQALRAAAGEPVEVGVYELKSDEAESMAVLNPAGVRLWRDGFTCPWAENGVWDASAEPRLLRPQHCADRGFYERYLSPFVRRYTAAIRSVHPEAAIFVEGSPGWGPTAVHGPPPLHGDPDRVVHAGHWYDG